MMFSDILNQLKINLQNGDVYTRSIFLGLKTIDVNISFSGSEYESIGLYLLTGKYEVQKNYFDKLYIECDFGFLCYINSKVRINVISNNIPLLKKVCFPFMNNIEYYDGLDLSLYDSMLFCNNIPNNITNNKTIADLKKYNANNVYIVDKNEKPYLFNLYNLDENVDSNVIDNVSNLSFYINNMISMYSKQITFYMDIHSVHFRTFSLLQINSIADLENNIKTCLNFYVPKLLSIVWNDKCLGINFIFKFGSCINVDNLKIDEVEAFSLLHNIYNSLISLFNVTDYPINITIESYDRKKSVINGIIYSSGLVTIPNK